jgi:thioredoxin-dependent peroxiredoxin
MIKAGDKAPDFTAKDQDGKVVTLSQLKGKKVVLYFYPKDMTPGCTAEACSLRDNYKALQRAGYEIFGISTDDEKSHRKFIEKEKLPFSLLADTGKAVHQLYGTWVEKSMYGRSYMGTARVTFIINEQGVVEEVVEKVDTKNHADQILKTAPAAAAKPRSAPKKKVAAKKPAKKSAAKKTAPKKAAKKKK